jgi:hypothetical protein
MIRKHGKHYFRLLPIWAGVLSLVMGFPLLGLASGYGHGDGSAHHATDMVQAILAEVWVVEATVHIKVPQNLLIIF